MKNYIAQYSFGGILANAWDIYRSHFVAVVLPYALLSAPFGLLTVWMEIEGAGIFSGAYWISTLLGFLAGLVAYVTIIVSVSEICLGGKPSVFRSLKYIVSEGLVWRFIAAGFLLGIGFLVGLVLFVIPGILFLFWFAFVEPIVLLEGSRVLNAFKRSRILGAGYNLRTAGVVFALGIPLAIAADITQGFLAASGEPLLGAFANLLIYVAGAPLVIISLLLMYYDLRVRKEAFNTVGLSEESNL